MRFCSTDAQGLGQHRMSILAANQLGEGVTGRGYSECKTHVDLQGSKVIY